MTDAQITTLKAALQSLITEYAVACAAPAPNYTKGNQTFAYADYMKMLREQIESLDQMISENEEDSNYEVITEMYT